MISIIAGVIFILFAGYAGLPLSWGLQWTDEVLLFLRGGIPVVAVCLGLLFILVGLMVFRDRARIRKEADKQKE